MIFVSVCCTSETSEDEWKIDFEICSLIDSINVWFCIWSFIEAFWVWSRFVFLTKYFVCLIFCFASCTFLKTTRINILICLKWNCIDFWMMCIFWKKNYRFNVDAAISERKKSTYKKQKWKTTNFDTRFMFWIIITSEDCRRWNDEKQKKNLNFKQSRSHKSNHIWINANDDFFVLHEHYNHADSCESIQFDDWNKSKSFRDFIWFWVLFDFSNANIQNEF